MLALFLGLSLLSPAAFAADIAVWTNPVAYPFFIADHGPVSECAGQTNTQPCALDTWLSCNMNSRYDHCEALGIHGKKALALPPKQKLAEVIGNNDLYAFRTIRRVK